MPSLLFQLLLLPVLAMVLFYAFMARVVPLRQGWPWWIAAVLVFVAVAGVLKIRWGIFSPQSYWIRLAAVPVLLVAAPLLIFQGPVWKRLLVNTFLYCGQMLGESICVQLLIPVDVGQNVDAFIAQMTLSQLLLYAALSQGGCVILYCAVTILARTLAARRFSFIYLPVFLFPVSLWGMMVGHFVDFDTWVWFVCISLGSVATVILLHYIVSLEEKDALKDQVRELRHAMELEQAHYRTVEERREELARIRHDFNNQLSSICRLMDGGEAEDARRMIALLKEDIASTRETPYCDIPVVNAVLEEKVRNCALEGVGLSVSLEFPQRLAVEPLHLCSIFANLLDNAICGAAASGREQPEIALTARVGGDYLFIRTVNPSAVSSVPAAGGRGYGIRILNDIAGRYGGSYLSSFENGIFSAQVSLLALPEL